MVTTSLAYFPVLNHLGTLPDPPLAAAELVLACDDALAAHGWLAGVT